MEKILSKQVIMNSDIKANYFRFKINLVLITVIGLMSILFACNKIDNPYPPSSALDQSLYPGTWADYVANEWPVFDANTNTNRNVLIEDFTGHKCIFCPAAAALAEDLKHANEGRVFIAGIHAGPTGIGTFQELHAPLYTHDFTNPQGLEIGNYFGTLAGSPFVGNPYGSISRFPVEGYNMHEPSAWSSIVDQIIATNDLKVNLQAKANYYEETRGLFLHTEIEKLNGFTNEIAQVVYLIEDSIVKPQSFPGGVDSINYVHHNVQRNCIDGNAFGKTVTENFKKENGKYYLNYSYKLPSQYAADNMHLLVYVFDKVSNEIYQVIKVDL
jgi:hypothetical protein